MFGGYPISGSLLILIGRRINPFRRHPALRNLNKFKYRANPVLGAQVGVVAVAIGAEALPVLNHRYPGRFCLGDGCLHIIDEYGDMRETVEGLV